MLRLKNIGIIFSFVTALSCTIVKDSDITSISQLNSLSLKSFEIVQNSQAGNSITLATSKYDSVVNRISAGTGAHISRVKGFALPALGNYKMKLKSGVNAATEIKIAYKDNGMLNACIIYQGDSTIESYLFFYNTSNQLIKVSTVLNPIDSKVPIHKTLDILAFGATGDVYPSTITRSSTYDATLTGTYTVCQNCSGSGSSSQSVNQLSFQQGQSQTYQLNFNSGGGNCSSNGYYPYSCGSINKTNSNGGGGQNGNQNQLSFINNFTFNKTIQTSLASISNTDTYYFHPLLILKDVVPQGDFYFWFYSVDWFQTAGSPFSNSDMVKINFNYGK